MSESGQLLLFGQYIDAQNEYNIDEDYKDTTQQSDRIQFQLIINIGAFAQNDSLRGRDDSILQFVNAHDHSEASPQN